MERVELFDQPLLRVKAEFGESRARQRRAPGRGRGGRGLWGSHEAFEELPRVAGSEADLGGGLVCRDGERWGGAGRKRARARENRLYVTKRGGAAGEELVEVCGPSVQPAAVSDSRRDRNFGTRFCASRRGGKPSGNRGVFGSQAVATPVRTCQSLGWVGAPLAWSEPRHRSCVFSCA